MNGCCDRLSRDEPLDARFAAFREAPQSRAALAQRPFEQRIVTTGDDSHRALHTGRTLHAERQPASNRGLWKQPFAGNLCARDRASDTIS
jgi:hypothetical protein